MKSPTTINLTYKKDDEIRNLSAFLWNQSASKTIIIVGGDGDTKMSLTPLAEKLITSKPVHTNILTISFSNTEEEDYKPLKAQGGELQQIIDWVLENLKTEIILISTSAGAYSVTKVATTKKNRGHISEIIYIDPADYTSTQIKEIRPSTWKDYENYQPKEAVVANRIKSTEEITINVVNLTIRNCTKDNYIEASKRHIDNPHLYPRLNNKMIKQIYKNIPQNCKGDYLEINTVPHAFLRDGNIEHNLKTISTTIQNIITE